ncbi:signal peptidase I SipW [Paenibacillus lentus]|uniref:Signal peptidase I n=1 Tax=Paenibacillus lentus TaxID=1338368 RepID=A0A3Q8S4J4_9BACL|nr:signal peptidase I [Paenibacillus lentus]AZK46278.1 signal peptidase I [Paenibacillus lentus]
MRLIWKTAVQALYCIILLFCVAVIGSILVAKITGDEPSFYGYKLKTVLSGSMEPAIRTGSVIAISTSDIGSGNRFKTGDIITFQADKHRLITHRIIEVRMNKADNNVLYRTQGDNNQAPDSALVSPANIVGAYTGFTIPYAGYFISFAVTKTGSIALLIIPGLLLFLYGAFSICKFISRLEQQLNDRVSPNSGSDHGSG